MLYRLNNTHFTLFYSILISFYHSPPFLICQVFSLSVVSIFPQILTSPSSQNLEPDPIFSGLCHNPLYPISFFNTSPIPKCILHCDVISNPSRIVFPTSRFFRFFSPFTLFPFYPLPTSFNASLMLRVSTSSSSRRFTNLSITSPNPCSLL